MILIFFVVKVGRVKVFSVVVIVKFFRCLFMFNFFGGGGCFVWYFSFLDIG